MPSHLTRQIFRRLLASEPIVYRGCLRRRTYSSLVRSARYLALTANCNGRRLIGYEQRRTFLNFNFFHKNERAEKDADMDPGLEKMMELEKRERMRARMPPVEDVAKALREFFEYKHKQNSRITDKQARLALQSLRYYLAEVAKQNPQEIDQVRQEYVQQRYKNNNPLEDVPWLLFGTHLLAGARALSFLPKRVDAAHVQLARLLYENLTAIGHKNGSVNALKAYIRALTATGETSQAELVLVNFEKQNLKTNGSTDAETSDPKDLLNGGPPEHEDLVEMDSLKTPAATPEEDATRTAMREPWMVILKGYVREENEVEVRRTLSIIETRLEHDAPRRLAVSLIMTEFCIKRDDRPGMRHWWDTYRRGQINAPQPATPKAGLILKTLLSWCLKNDALEVGHAIVKDLMKPNPPKEFWDAVFVWAAGTGKGPDEIDRMISVMEKSNESVADESQWRTADIDTINALVELAVNRKDPYMAERFITLGQRRGIEPNARTYVLQMEYRLSVDDVDGALIAYKSLQSMDVSSNEDLPTVNKLIIALCKTQRHDFDTIMNVTADLSDRRARFEAETISALALLHLRRDEHTDVIDLLNTHAYHYSTAERDAIRDAILKIALDPNTPTGRAWNGYLIINDFFDETPRPQRTELMEAFMSRERPDMGVRIFQQMRAHSRTDTMPTVETYAAAFLGLAKIRELDSLEVVHNQLKLDYNVTPTTYLYNALMLAFTACGDSSHGLQFWNDIVASKEGPSYNSIHIALRACEKTAFGDLKAREIWSLLRRRNVELDHNLWCSYFAALCGNGNVDQSLNAVEEAEEKGEVIVDEFLIGSICDSTPKHDEKQAMIEEWAQERYPEVWKKLQEVVGFEVTEGGSKVYKIDRRVSP